MLPIPLSPAALAVAADMKRRGLHVNTGDPLPLNLDRTVAQEIHQNLGWFRLAWMLAPSEPPMKGHTHDSLSTL